MKRILLYGILLQTLVSANTLYGQGDTVKFRTVVSLLDDSTRFRYEIGQIALQTSSGIFFIPFATSGGYDVQNYLKSAPFSPTSGSDSLSFCRFVSFDNKYYLGNNTPLDSARTDSLALAWIQIMSTKEISPILASFNGSSSVNYILEAVNASNNSVSLIIDTIHCYKNSNGYLRYSTTENSLDKRKIGLGSLSTSLQYYLRVRKVYNLPYGASFIADTGAEFANEFPSFTPRWHRYQDDGIIPAYKTTSNENSSGQWLKLESLLEDVSISFDEITDKVNINYRTSEAGVVYFEIYNIIGDVMLNEKKDITEGQHTHSVNLGFLRPNSTYFLRVRDAGRNIYNFKFAN